MRGLKIQDKWIQLILNGQKAMEVRSLYFKIKGMRIALGNSGTGMLRDMQQLKMSLRFLILR